MSVEELRAVLGWSVLINYVILFLWFGTFALARDWMFRLHGQWFRLSDTGFDALHYGLMGGFKLLVIVFNLVPWIALHIVA